MHDESDLDRYDEKAVQRFVRPLYPLFRRYFRADIQISTPLSQQSIFVANHSGGMTPVDWLIYLALTQHLNGSRMYVLIHPMFTRFPPLRRALARRGIVRASANNFYGAIDRGASVLVFPGGDDDAFRPFRDRSQVNLGERYGFARVAIKTGVPIVPVVSAGSHHTIFVMAQGSRVARTLRLDKLGIRTFPLILCFPWVLAIGPMSLLPTVPLPARVTILSDEAPIQPPQIGNEKIKEVAKRFYRQTSDAMNELLGKAYRRRNFRERQGASRR